MFIASLRRQNELVINRVRKILDIKGFHHLFPILIFVLFAAVFYSDNYYQYQKDPQKTTGNYTFYGTFLHGRYDQGNYRGIGISFYEGDTRYSAWYPGISILGGILWRLSDKPSGDSGCFYWAFYLPSIFSGAVFFYCFYRYAYRRWGAGAAIFSLLSLSSFPPSFYFLTAYPYNLVLMCMTSYLLLYESQVKRRFLYLGVLGFYCSISYPTAALFVVFPVTAEFLKQWRERKFLYHNYIWYALPFILGPLSFYTYLYLVTGDFFAFFNAQTHHIQIYYHRKLLVDPIKDALNNLYQHSAIHPGNLMTILLVIYFSLFSTKKLGFPLWGYMLSNIMVSILTGGYGLIYRYSLLSFPVHYLLGISSKHSFVKIIMICISGYFCVRHFFLLYLRGMLE